MNVSGDAVAGARREERLEDSRGEHEDEVLTEEERAKPPRLRKVQFTVDAQTVEKLEKSKKLHHDASLAQSFRRAAALSAFLDEKRSEGFEVYLQKGDEVYKIFIP